MEHALQRVETMIMRWGFSHLFRVRACLVLMPADGIIEMGSAVRDLDLGLGGRVEVLQLAELLKRLTAGRPYGDTLDEKRLAYHFIDLLKPMSE